MGVWSLFQLPSGGRQGTPGTSPALILGLNTDIHFCGSFSITISLIPQIHVCQLWEKGGGPGETPSRGKESVRTPSQKGDLTP